MLIRIALIICTVILLPYLAFANSKYTVKQGDNLYDISKKYDVTVDQLKQANNLKSIKLDIGDVLTIPASKTSSSTKKYTVINGDTLGGIAVKFGLSSSRVIKSANGLEKDNLKVGQVLIIPSTSNSTTAKKATVETKKTNTAKPESKKPALFAKTSKPKKTSPTKYTVKKGDTLGAIAVKHGLSSSRVIKAANDLEDNNLHIGQVITIPSPEHKTVSAESLKEPALKVAAKSTTHKKLSVTVIKTSTPEKIELATRPTTHIYKSQVAKPAVEQNPKQKSNEPKSTTTHTVKSGDTLGAIAVHYGLASSKAIKTANKLDSNNLKVGQVLVIPVPGSKTESIEPKVVASEVKPKAETTKTETANKASESTTKSTLKYTVKNGDTLGGIAVKHGLSSSRVIKAANKLESDNVRVGQVLIIPSTNNIAKVNESKFETKKPVESPEKTSATTKYKVKKGDTLGAIAVKHGLSSSRVIKAANGLKGDNLTVGQVLTIPSSNNAVISSKSTDTKTPNTVDYKVKKGDTLLGIAIKFKTKVADIKDRNNLKNSSLKQDQKLKIPTSLTEAEIAKATESKTTKEKKETVNKQATYKVKKGDTVGHIAIKLGVTQKQLKQANNLKNNNLKIGQVLKNPNVKSENSTVTKSTRTENYKVTKGDSLGSIANKFRVSVKEIKAVNGMKSSRLIAGKTIKIPVNDKFAQTQKTPKSHKVAKGDTLGAIAQKYGVTVKELKKANGLKGNNIHVGKKLVIPGKYQEVAKKVAKTEPAKKQSSKHIRYVVKKGETLGTIARDFGVTTDEIKNLNDLKGSSIRAGEIIKMPVDVSSIPNDNYNPHSIRPNKGFIASNGNQPREEIILAAKSYLGTPYKFGGNSLVNGIDCSGYVKKIFGLFNINLPRTARDLYNKAGYYVDRQQLETGDLVFFTTYAKYPSHVGIYIGNDQFIHASSASKKVTITSLNKKYYRSRYIGAKRIKLSGYF